LLIKALRNERIREIYLCANAFNVFNDRYPQLCKFRTSVLYPKPLIAKNYPSEILQGRLYLGDQFHAQDKSILKHLRVTHIVNVTDKLPNHFEHSRTVSAKYLKIHIEDYNCVQIKLSFPLVYKFIVAAFEESKDFYKSPARSNPLVDDVFQTQMDMSKRQRMSKKAIAHLDTLVVDLNKKKSVGAEEEVKEEGEEEKKEEENDIMRDIEKYKMAVKRKEDKHNAVAYKIDT
jgi:hypothetical protein